MRVCIRCGKPIEGKWAGTKKYCSIECSRKERNERQSERRRKKSCDCLWCGKEFKPIYKERFCSDECRINQRRKQNRDSMRRKRGYKPLKKQCPQCGALFIAEGSQYTRKIFCSNRCANIQHSRNKGVLPLDEYRELAKKRSEERKRIAEQEKKDSILTKECKVCGKTFKTYKSHQVICLSDKCKKRNSSRDKRISKEQLIDKGINLKKLYQRDNGRCYICGGECDWNDTLSNRVGDTYPTIEHLLPISAGGLHSWDNIRLAHWKCNVDKSDSINEELIKRIHPTPYILKSYRKQRRSVSLVDDKGNVIETYESIAEAGRKNNLNPKRIQQVASGEKRIHKGTLWKYTGI